VRLQPAVPVQPPLHPAKVSFVAGVSLNATTLFGAKLAEHVVVAVAEQVMPAGLLVTVPVPAPASATVTATPGLKAAATLVAADTVTAHAPAPEQPPLHPPKYWPEAGVSLSETCVPGAKFAEHVVGQLIPAGLLMTVPVPVRATVRASPPVNAAVTFVAAVRVMAQVLAPEQPPPLHPPKYSPVAGVSVSVTCVFGAKPAEQVPGQLIPAGLLVTVPVPVTATVTESPALKDAATLVVAVRVTAQVLVPEQPPPLQPPKNSLEAGFAVSVTCVFDAKLAEQVPGQLMPAGLLVTVPVAEVGPVTVSCKFGVVVVVVGEFPNP